MGKKSVGRHGAKPAFRESDFAGRPPQEQADLSGSLNQLSQQLAATRRVLQALAVPEPPSQAAECPRPPDGAARQGHSSDDDTAVPL